jgi:hypothetical protein
MHQQLSFVDPEAILSTVEAEMEGIASEELFNNPKYQPLLDQWCAGSFVRRRLCASRARMPSRDGAARSTERC